MRFVHGRYADIAIDRGALLCQNALMVTRRDIIELMRKRYELPVGKGRRLAYIALTKQIDAMQRELSKQEQRERSKSA